MLANVCNETILGDTFTHIIILQNNKFLEATELSDCTSGCIGVIDSSEDWCYKENVKCHGNNNQLLRRSADDDGGSGFSLSFE